MNFFDSIFENQNYSQSLQNGKKSDTCSQTYPGNIFPKSKGEPYQKYGPGDSQSQIYGVCSTISADVENQKCQENMLYKSLSCTSLEEDVEINSPKQFQKVKSILKDISKSCDNLMSPDEIKSSNSTKKCVSFSSDVIYVPADHYDRKSFEMKPLTPDDKFILKLELNHFKSTEMIVHPESTNNTLIYQIKFPGSI